MEISEKKRRQVPFGKIGGGGGKGGGRVCNCSSAWTKKSRNNIVREKRKGCSPSSHSKGGRMRKKSPCGKKDEEKERILQSAKKYNT